MFLCNIEVNSIDRLFPSHPYQAQFSHSQWPKLNRVTRHKCLKARHETDNHTIGLILCQDKKRVLAEYALRGMNKPSGVSEFELTRILPETLKSTLPTIEEIEAEFSVGLQDEDQGRL